MLGESLLSSLPSSPSSSPTNTTQPHHKPAHHPGHSRLRPGRSPELPKLRLHTHELGYRRDRHQSISEQLVGAAGVFRRPLRESDFVHLMAAELGRGE